MQNLINNLYGNSAIQKKKEKVVVLDNLFFIVLGAGFSLWSCQLQSECQVDHRARGRQAGDSARANFGGDLRCPCARRIVPDIEARAAPSEKRLNLFSLGVSFYIEREYFLKILTIKNFSGIVEL